MSDDYDGDDVPDLRCLLERAARGENVQAIMDELGDEADQRAVVEDAKRRADEAQRRLQDVCHEAAMEGNDHGDFDDDIDAAASDLIHARDMAFKARDPEWYEERRQMGCL